MFSLVKKDRRRVMAQSVWVRAHIHLLTKVWMCITAIFQDGRVSQSMLGLKSGTIQAGPVSVGL